MRMIVFLLIIFSVTPVRADIASIDYVDNAGATKVDTASTANQTMAGSYTVSGTLVVPTPPLPSAE